MDNKSSSQHYKKLKDKWVDKHKEVQKKLIDKHKESLDKVSSSARQLAIGTIGGVLLLSSPSSQLLSPPAQSSQRQEFVGLNPRIVLITNLAKIIPESVGELTKDQELEVSEILNEHYGIKVVPELNGKRLNHTYGYIGAEQHLMRYPGDNMGTHFKTSEDSKKYYSSGMAPGRGAWGYFSYSRDTMAQEDVDREKYYIAVQTFLVPEYSSNVREYSQFFKYRKMLVVNPANGKAIVVVIGDAGPAKWTGKQLGGSPEVMKYLQRVDGKARGGVLYFFVDDPEDRVPLGPVESSSTENLALR